MTSKFNAYKSSLVNTKFISPFYTIRQLKVGKPHPLLLHTLSIKTG